LVTFTGITGITYQLKDTPFAGGGEGYIFYVIGNPFVVASIYKPDKCTTERHPKLSVIVRIKPSV
jgi:hypothetical protein